MKFKKVKSVMLLSIISMLFVAGAILNQPNVDATSAPFFALVIKPFEATPYMEYALFIKQQLANIGIDGIIALECGVFLDTLLGTRDFDLAVLGFGGGGVDFYALPNAAYRENSSLNLWGYDTNMDYNDVFGTGQNEWYIKEGNLIMPPESDERIQHAWNWADYMQTELLPMKPLYAPLKYVAYWDNLIGYNYTEGIRKSWGKMSWDGLHPGQKNTNEIIITEDMSWGKLNPFLTTAVRNEVLISYCLDSLFDIDPDLSIWPMLAKSWTWVDDCTIDIQIRDGIKWPDYATFNNEYVTTDDVYFSLYCWQNISKRYKDWFWLHDYEKLDNMTIRLQIDGDPDTPWYEPYAGAIIDLVTWIVPEHFLNQTQLPDGITPDVTHPSWEDYSTNVWGTDIFEIKSITENVEAILIHNEESWHFDTAVTSDSHLDYLNRYGDYSSELDTLKIRIIPYPEESFLEFMKGGIDLDFSQLYHKQIRYPLDPPYDLQSDTTNFFTFVAYNMREDRDYIGSREPCPLDPSMTIGLAIRKAISYAIDRTEMNQIIHNNMMIIWDYPNYPTLGIWNNPNIIRYNYDLEKAKEYMTKAGFDLGWTQTIGFSVPFTITSLFVIVGIGYLIVKRKKIKYQ
ncbi:MAG: hypothetical protein FK733_14970 [Asgard group archaeon]|nr:hypothetical protein [Asgard group archaeon]